MATKNEDWIEHDGGDQPVADDVRVQVLNSRGWLMEMEACFLIWSKVTAYRLVSA